MSTTRHGGGGGGWNRGSKPRQQRIARTTVPVDKARAPYTWVPLSETVVDRPLVEQISPGRISHDLPFSDGISGVLQVAVRPHGPLFVRSAEDPQRHFSLPKDRWAVPGSTIRGSLRNVVEIASFGRMRRINDHRYAVRDLHNRELYGRHMSTIRDKTTTPLVSSGWLRRNTGEDAEEFPAILAPCSFAKIHYNELQHIANQRGCRRFDPGRKQSSPNKYKDWGDAEREITLDFETLERHGTVVDGAPRMGHYGRCRGLDGPARGTLVFTGQPRRWDAQAAPKRKGAGNPKQHDFVFLNDRASYSEIKVSKRVWEDFLFAHRGTGEQRRLTDQANPELRHWLDETDWEGRRGGDSASSMPVFFLLHGDECDPATGRPVLRAMGLALMFRLAYRTSVGEAVVGVQGEDQGEPDLADLIFGFVPDGSEQGSGRHGGLKGRVAFGHALLEGGARQLGRVRAVLGTPKASYYPFYVEQREDVPGGEPLLEGGKPRYRSWMDPDARPRGWKRYKVLDGQLEPLLPTDSKGRKLESDRVASVFHPLQPSDDAVFVFPLRLHNLRPFELGALLWALDFGGAPDTFHLLGMARSLGYGKVSYEVRDNGLRDLNRSPVDLDACRQAHADFMERALSGRPNGWAGSREIFELLAAATPGPEVDGDHRHMQLHHPDFANEFVSVKTQGLALPPAGDREVFEARGGVATPVRTRKGSAKLEQRPGTAVGGSVAVGSSAPAPAVVVGPTEEEQAQQRQVELDDLVKRVLALPAEKRFAVLLVRFGDLSVSQACFEWVQRRSIRHVTQRAALAGLDSSDRPAVEDWLVASGVIQRWNLPAQRPLAKQIKRAVKKRRRAKKS